MVGFTILQIGTNIGLYLNIFAVILIGVFFLLSLFFLYKGIKTKKFKKMIGISLLFLFLSFMSVVVIFFAMGPGEPTRSKPIEQDGTYQQIMKHPKEINKDSIKLNAKNNKPYELKIQDSSFEKEAKEADDYIQKALEKYK